MVSRGQFEKGSDREGKTKMVPSDPLSSPFTSRHARRNMACTGAVAFPFCSSSRLLTRLNQRSGVHPQTSAARSRHLETAFYSPATTALFRKPPRRDRRFQPISSMPFQMLLRARSAVNSAPRPLSSWRCPTDGEVHRLQPVARFLIRNFRTSTRFRSSSGPCDPSGS